MARGTPSSLAMFLVMFGIQAPMAYAAPRARTLAPKSRTLSPPTLAPRSGPRAAEPDDSMEYTTTTTLRRTLFFSQFQEGDAGSSNKYFEIYNPTDVSVDLANEYSIATCTDGCGSGPTFTDGFTFASSATIEAGGTYLVCHSGMNGDTSACAETIDHSVA